MMAPGPRGRQGTLRWALQKTAAAFLLILLAAVPGSATETAARTTGGEIFTVRVGSYPLQRWADQAADHYLRQDGVYAFVVATVQTGGNCRYHLYLGKFDLENDARNLGRNLAGDHRISPAWAVESVSPALFRSQPAICYAEKNTQDEALTDNAADRGDLHMPPVQPGQTPTPEKGTVKAPDHHRLIRSILGGLSSPGYDQVVALDAPPAPESTNSAPSTALSPQTISPEFELVPFTDN